MPLVMDNGGKYHY